MEVKGTDIEEIKQKRRKPEFNTAMTRSCILQLSMPRQWPLAGLIFGS